MKSLKQLLQEIEENNEELYLPISAILHKIQQWLEQKHQEPNKLPSWKKQVQMNLIDELLKELKQ